MSIAISAPRVVADTFGRSYAKDALLVILGAVTIGIAAQLSVHLPGNPIPITGQTFAVLLVAAALGTARGVLATILYAIAGIAGVPWFAGAKHGVVLVTIGYILGFILAAALVGALAQRGGTKSPSRTFGTMLVGSVAIYAVGVPWLKVALGVDWATAVTLGMAPFILADFLKAALAAGLFAAAWALIRRNKPRGHA